MKFVIFTDKEGMASLSPNRHSLEECLKSKVPSESRPVIFVGPDGVCGAEEASLAVVWDPGHKASTYPSRSRRRSPRNAALSGPCDLCRRWPRGQRAYPRCASHAGGKKGRLCGERSGTATDGKPRARLPAAPRRRRPKRRGRADALARSLEPR